MTNANSHELRIEAIAGSLTLFLLHTKLRGYVYITNIVGYNQLLTMTATTVALAAAHTAVERTAEVQMSCSASDEATAAMLEHPQRPHP